VPKKVPRLDKRFGPRYGATVRKRWNMVMLQKVQKYVCPQCGYKKVRWVAVGIWRCRKCGFTFAGGAYTPFTTLKELKVEW
jgi:large subunit ribosomal protein L37Ae